MSNARIVVVGCGISGISTAAKLIENGIQNVVILEAENRIGGRVHTVPFANNVLDLGGQWCHGEKGNVCYELVKNHNVLDESKIKYPNVNFLSSSGKHLEDEKCGRLVALCQTILENCEDDLKNFKGSLGNYIIAKYQEALKTKEFSDIDFETSYQVLDYFHKFENSIEASDSWFDTSASGYLQYWECEGHPLLNWKDKGYKTVIDYITKKKPDPANSLDVESKILLNKEVNNIEWTKTNATVRCSDGTSYVADHVVVTASLGVLKENYKSLFTPSLPQIKINAIEGLSIGVVDKIFLEFEKPFWNEEWAGISLLWTEKDSREIRATSNSWVEDVFGFYRVDYQPNVLCGWIGGPSARKMETLDDATVFNGCLFLFEKFLTNRIKWTKPVKMLRSQWYTNKHFRGSYSFRSITTEMMRTSAKDLAQPLYNSLGKPTLLFAGEATSDHYYSTVHGAVEAGWREGQRLIDFYAGYSSMDCDRAFNTNVPKMMKRFDVIILGAGIAGLGAGKRLKEANTNFIILEGSDRVGGRINTVEMKNLRQDFSCDKVLVDAGAQWIHGRQNDLFKFAEGFKLIHPELSEEAEGDFLREDGFRFDDFFVKRVDFKIGQILEECEEFVKLKSKKNSKFPASIEEFVNDKFKSFLDELETSEEKRHAIQLLDWHRKFQIIDNSCLHFSDISAKDWGNYSFNGECAQTHINIRNGMSKIVEKLHQHLQEHVNLNQVVQQIYWKSEEYPGAVNKIKVSCKDGSVYTANNLICTFSLGVLKESHLEMFSPPLPTAHREVIENIGFGTINKIFLHFQTRWWSDDWKGMQLIWNEELSDNSHWTKFISGFDVIYPEPENTLLGWIGGKGAIEVETLSDKEIADQCMQVIRIFLKNSSLPDPVKFHCSRWNSNPLVRGAYSFTSKLTDHIKNWEEVLSKPLICDHKIGCNKNILLLSGEHCHEQYFSTVHGAFLSGVQQAEKILSLRKENTFRDCSCLSKL